MLLKVNVKNKNETIYRCDKCKRTGKRKYFVTIFAKIRTENDCKEAKIKKKFDLCKSCYKKTIGYIRGVIE